MQRLASGVLASVFVCAPVGGCFQEPDSVGEDTDGDDEDDDDDDDDDANDDGNDDGADADGDGDGDDDDDDGDDDDDDDGSAYPSEVTDVLDLPVPPFDYENPDLPAHFTAAGVDALDNTPADNPVTNDGATLGRVLFYDTLLSANDTTACASCHAQSLAFTDDAAASEGFEGGLTGRNSMGIANARWYQPGRFFWDERAATLEAQVLGPIQDPVEMGLTLDELVERVSGQPYYPPLFERAFGDTEVTSDRIAAALAQFVRATVSTGSRYDEGLAMVGNPTDPFPGLSMAENRGKEIFFGPEGGCAVCHVGNPPPGGGGPPQFGNAAVFMMLGPANNGLPPVPEDEDLGVGAVTGDPADNGAFKSTSLRNIAISGPYMHDGRFETLAEVVEHYNNGVFDTPNLDPRLREQGGGPRRLELSETDKAALVAFMTTLTDEPLLEEVRYSDPFR